MPRTKKRAAAPPETISLRQACLRIGISVPTAAKINATAPGDFPAVFWIGGRRYVLRRALREWLASRAALGSQPQPTNSHRQDRE